MASTTTTLAGSKVLAALRLQQDMREMAVAPPLPMTSAADGSRWGIIANPADEKDLFLWDVKMVAASGPQRGREIKMRMQFPNNYPTNPPDVNLLTSIPRHPNVFGNWICLDMLKDPEEYAKPYEGWSAAYRVSGVLLQLYGFLLVDTTVDQMYGGGRVQRGEEREDRGSDRGEGREEAPLRWVPEPNPGPREVPGATYVVPPPAVRHPSRAPGATPPAQASRPVQAAARDVPDGGVCRSAAEAGVAHLDRLDDHMVRHMLDSLSAEDLLRCMATGSTRLATVAEDVKQRRELECFFSRRSYADPSTVLGFGVNREWFTGKRANTLRSLVVRLDYLSLHSFRTADVRRSAWNAPIDGFLPLYLNPEHGPRALRALPSCVAHLLSKGQALPSAQSGAGAPRVEPQQLLTVLSQAMNSLVVEMVRLDKGSMPMHMSDNALRGFAHLHHLLLAVAVGPEGAALVAEAQRNVRRFVHGAEGGRARHKQLCPDLGVLLVELLLVPKEEMSWQEFMPPFLRELLSREVMWVLQAEAPAPPSRKNDSNDESQGYQDCTCSMCTAARARAAISSLRSGSTYSSGRERISAKALQFGVVAGENPAGDSKQSLDRMKTHFESAVTGLRAMQLTCWFGLELARPATTAGIMAGLGVIKAGYDSGSGAPPARALAAFHAHARTVMQAKSWCAALSGLRVALRCTPPPAANGRPDPRGVWAAVLRQAVVDSWVAGYHQSPAPWGRGPAVPLQGQTRALAPCLPAPAAKPPVDPEAWQEVKGKRAALTQGPRVRGSWGYAPEPERLTMVQTVFGQSFVDWEGVWKPVAAIHKGL